MMRIKVFSLILGLLISGNAIRAEHDAGMESPFSLGAGARALGMGGGFTALSNDASSVYYNPARLPLLLGQEVTFMHATLFEGTKYDFGAWALPIGDRFGAAVGFMRIGTDDIIARENFAPVDTISFSQSQLMFAYGSRVTSHVYFGGGFKVMSQSLGTLSDYSFGADLAVSISITDHFSLGFIARDLLVPELELDTVAEKSSRSMVAALGLREFPLTDYLDFSLAVDVERTENRETKYLSGVEFLMAKRYSLRGGYNRDNITLGGGLKLDRLNFDYAYKIMDFIDNSHRFSITWNIGTDKRTDVRQTLPQPKSEFQPLPAHPKAAETKKAALEFFVNSMLDSALYYYHLSLEYDSTDAETKRMIVAVETARAAELTKAKVDTLVQREQFADQYYHQAYEFYTKEYYPAAMDLLEIVLEIDPGYSRALVLEQTIRNARVAQVEAYVAEAVVARGEGRVIDEIEAYNRILDLEPDHQEIKNAKLRALAGLDLDQQLSLGVRLFSMGRYRAAQRRFEAVLRIDAKDPVAIEYLQRITGTESAPSSLEELQQDRTAWNLYLEAIRYMRNGEYAKAIEAWRKVLEIFPGNVNTLNNLEQARLRLNSGEEQ